MKRWYVVTPEFTEMVTGWNLPEGGYPETGCEVIEVEAPTKRAAKVAAVRQCRAKPHSGCWFRDVDGNPYVGLKVYSAEPEDYPSDEEEVSATTNRP